MQVFNEAIEQALKDGFTGFRAAADMSWALRVKNGARRLIAYEALLRTLFASCGATGLCLYDRKRMPLRVLNGALATHPLVGIGGAFQASPHYDSTVTTVPRVSDRLAKTRLELLKPASRSTAD